MGKETHFFEPEPVTRPAYRAFLLRCWQEKLDGETSWRFTLEEIGGETTRRGFDSFHAVTAFLQAELRTEPPGGGGSSQA